jgi:hypothetical protein
MEPKWQQIRERDRTFHVTEDAGKPNSTCS